MKIAAFMMVGVLGFAVSVDSFASVDGLPKLPGKLVCSGTSYPLCSPIDYAVTLDTTGLGGVLTASEDFVASQDGSPAADPLGLARLKSGLTSGHYTLSVRQLGLFCQVGGATAGSVPAFDCEQSGSFVAILQNDTSGVATALGYSYVGVYSANTTTQSFDATVSKTLVHLSLASSTVDFNQGVSFDFQDCAFK